MNTDVNHTTSMHPHSRGETNATCVQNVHGSRRLRREARDGFLAQRPHAMDRALAPDERSRARRESSAGPPLLAPQARRPDSAAFPSSTSSRSLASSNRSGREHGRDRDRSHEDTVTFPSTGAAPRTNSRVVSSAALEPAPARTRRTSTRTEDGQRVATSLRSVSTGTPLNRQNSGGAFAAALKPTTLKPDRRWEHLDAQTLANRASATKASRSLRSGPTSGDESASESGQSALSNFVPTTGRPTRARGSTPRDVTNSPLRTWARWMRNSGKSQWLVPTVVAVALLVKFAVGLGSYSGQLPLPASCSRN